MLHHVHEVYIVTTSAHILSLLHSHNYYCLSTNLHIVTMQGPSAFGNDKTPICFVVTRFHFTGWEEQGCPDVSTGILQMSESINVVQRSTGSKAITVVCK